MTPISADFFAPDDLQGWVTLIASSLALVAGALGWVRVRLVRPFRAKWQRVEAALDQLKPNGGGSLSDLIRGMSTRLTLVGSRVFSILDNDDKAIYECGVDGKCTFANKALSELFGMDKHDMLGNGWLSAVAFGDRDTTYNVWMASVRDRRPYDAIYHVVNQRTGKPCRVLTHADPIEVDGEIVAYRGTLEIQDTAA